MTTMTAAAAAGEGSQVGRRRMGGGAGRPRRGFLRPGETRPPALRRGLGVVEGWDGPAHRRGHPPQFLDPGQQLGIGLDPHALLGAHLVVEVGGGEVVELGGVVGHGCGLGRSGEVPGFPSGSASSAASAARPREMRDRTVPAGIPSTSAISA